MRVVTRDAPSAVLAKFLRIEIDRLPLDWSNSDAGDEARVASAVHSGALNRGHRQEHSGIRNRERVSYCMSSQSDHTKTQLDEKTGNRPPVLFPDRWTGPNWADARELAPPSTRLSQLSTKTFAVSGASIYFAQISAFYDSWLPHWGTG